jgi:hypothetical protein
LSGSLRIDLLRVVADAGFARIRGKILAESALLKIHVLPLNALVLAGLSAEVHALGELPGLDTTEEETGGDEDDGPLPGDALVLEHGVADDGDVLDGEEGDEAEHDGPEEELVAPDIVHPLGEVELGAGLHAEERSALVNHLPGEEEGEPGETSKGGSTGLEDGLTAFAVVIVTVLTELTVTESIQTKDEGAKAESSDPETVDTHIDDELEGEDTSLERNRGSAKNTSDSTLETETHVGKTRSHHDDPHDLDGSDREDGETCLVLEDETDKKDDGLSDVGGEHVEDELLDVVEDTATFLDGGDDGGEVVVAENDVGCVLCDVGTGLTHGNTNIGTAERGGVVNTITSLLKLVYVVARTWRCRDIP